MSSEWCNALLVLLSQLALWVNNLWGWLLANAGEALPRWWDRQPYAVKVLVLGAMTVALGTGGWALGQFVFECAGWMSFSVAAFMIVSAIAGLFISGKRWEQGKRVEAEDEADELRRENLELRAELTALAERP